MSRIIQPGQTPKNPIDANFLQFAKVINGLGKKVEELEKRIKELEDERDKKPTIK